MERTSWAASVVIQPVKATIYNAGPPVSTGFQSRLLHSRLASLLRHLGEQQQTIHTLGPCQPHRRPGWRSRFMASIWSTHSHYSHFRVGMG